ncbi:hypothetical protein [Citricoccus sp.]|uniref:hypothetical protein n=1 Tax=Citricoccus sp. TaxID=1978372 RepID=UPI00262198A9|nr:hypothetical protein [Citricoccus sp.]HRO31293.1 hypothetical protein [Citricoccus sp.]
MTQTRQSHPELAPGAASKSITTDTSTLPDPEVMLNGVHVVMVAWKVAGEVRYRRRFFVNLSAAQRAMDKAVERGQATSLTLCQLATATGTGWTNRPVKQ